MSKIVYLKDFGMKKTVSIRVDEHDLFTFKKNYPSCLARFISICVKMAIKDRKFFDKIFFNNEFSEV